VCAAPLVLAIDGASCVPCPEGWWWLDGSCVTQIVDSNYTNSRRSAKGLELTKCVVGVPRTTGF
jgi:hypothetical protein